GRPGPKGPDGNRAGQPRITRGQASLKADSMKPIASIGRNQTLGPHPEEAALFARPSRRMAAGTISLVAVLRDARILRQAQERAPQDEAYGCRYDSYHGNAVLDRAVKPGDGSTEV